MEKTVDLNFSSTLNRKDDGAGRGVGRMVEAVGQPAQRTRDEAAHQAATWELVLRSADAASTRRL